MRRVLVVLVVLVALVFGVAAAWRSRTVLGWRWALQTSLERHQRVASVRVDGVDELRMFLNPDDDVMTPWIQLHHSWEDNETYWFSQSVGPGDTIVDAGANIGYYTLLGSRLVGETGRVYAFEPDPVNFALLEANIRVNGLHNVVAEQKALSNEPGSIQLFLAEHNKGDHRIFASKEEERPSIDVEAVTLDDYFAGRENEIDFVKIDTQGAEGAIIEGMTGILAKNDHMRMVVEYSPAHLEEFGFPPEDLIRRLEGADFRFFDIALGGDKRLPLKPVTGASLRSITADSNVFTNLFCVKGRAELERLESDLRASQAALAGGGPEILGARFTWEAEQLRSLETHPWTPVTPAAIQAAHGEVRILLPLGTLGVTGLRIDWVPPAETVLGPEGKSPRARVAVALERPAGETGAETPVPIAEATADGGLIATLPRQVATGSDGDEAKDEPSNTVGLQLDPNASGSVVLTFPAALDTVGELVVRLGPGASPEQLHFLVTQAKTPLPPRVIRALRTPSKERTPEQNGVLDLNFRTDSPVLEALRERVRASRAAVAEFQRIEPTQRRDGGAS